MKLIQSIPEMQKIVYKHKANNQTVAVVPTMGYLHRGHTSLIQKANELADIVITTLFVNPTQFAPNEDFERYPKSLDKDKELSKDNGSDYLFCPNVLEMYPIGFQTKIDITKVTQKFEGQSRPDHFSGVATVVAKLFNATLPDFAIFGQKDYQQTMVIKQLAQDLNFPVAIVVAPTIREADGLAMSSRNTYLNEPTRKKATILFLALEEAKNAIFNGETRRTVINSIMLKKLKEVQEIQVDYACAADSRTLDTPGEFLAGDHIVLLIAAYLGKTRLIDNAVLTIPSKLNKANF